MGATDTPKSLTARVNDPFPRRLRFSPVRVIRNNELRLVHALPSGGGIGKATDGTALFDLRTDPECQMNLIGVPAYRQCAASLAERLTKWRLDTADPWRPSPAAG
ncbi:hypothetical protein C1T17_15590 [Sphingobium sp. SCG-1]|uniref:hypothetical protein n=1 Tax=Sphingobium sp. SCG-1 TaxID=2072936 RepID=UPI000CD68416|nr:hypothetical protein [Sphingobium sp. SCG-1]AUW59298.1 hypothetical protein C1T17_15590 [Sphingobium sp. SCG-1]